MCYRNQWIIPVLFVVFAISMPSRASPYVITAQDWAMPRSVAHLVAFPPLAQAVGQLRVHPDSRLQIHYPGGDEGMLWLNELQSWLVALGVSSERMELIPGSSRQTVIEIDLVTANGKSIIKTSHKQNNNEPVVNQ